MLTTTRRQLPATTPTVAQTTRPTQMMTTRAMSTSSGNQRGMAGNRASGGSSTGGIGYIGANTQASGSVAALTATATTTIKTRTTITSDPGILCFHHCNVKVFCFTLPHICPQCKTPLDTQHPNGTNNKRQMKNKKRTTNANEASANTKGRNHLANNGDADNVDNIHDDDAVARHNDGNTNKVDDGDDDEDDEDDDSNENSFVCHIMASRLLPFRLPYPFVRANQYPCAIVLRPTTGDFLK